MKVLMRLDRLRRGPVASLKERIVEAAPDHGQLRDCVGTMQLLLLMAAGCKSTLSPAIENDKKQHP